MLQFPQIVLSLQYIYTSTVLWHNCWCNAFRSLFYKSVFCCSSFCKSSKWAFTNNTFSLLACCCSSPFSAFYSHSFSVCLLWIESMCSWRSMIFISNTWPCMGIYTPYILDPIISIGKYWPDFPMQWLGYPLGQQTHSVYRLSVTDFASQSLNYFQHKSQ